MVSHQNLPFRVSSCLLRCHPLLPGRKDRAGFDLLTTSSSLQRQVTSRDSSKNTKDNHPPNRQLKTRKSGQLRTSLYLIQGRTGLFAGGTGWRVWCVRQERKSKSSGDVSGHGRNESALGGACSTQARPIDW